MSSRTIGIDIYRFHNKAAFYLSGNQKTVYLTEKEARKVANKLLQCARSIKTESFTESNVKQLSIDIDGGPV